MVPEDSAEKMLAALSRGDWHGSKEISQACCIEENLVHSVDHQLRHRGYKVEVEQGRDWSRYRLP